MGIVNLVQYLKLSLCHHDLYGLAFTEFDIDWEDADTNFVMNLRQTIPTFGQGNNAFAGQGVPGSHDRMTGKRNLARWCKDPKPSQNIGTIFSCFGVSRKHKDSLGEIHLPSDFHHLVVRDSFCLRKYGEWVTGKWGIGENIQLNKTIFLHACLLGLDDKIISTPSCLVKRSLECGGLAPLCYSETSVYRYHKAAPGHRTPKTKSC